MKYKDELRKWQREFLMTAILKASGNMVVAAQSVGINRTHFYKQCDRLGIKRTDQRRGRKITVNKGNKAWQELGRQEHAS